MMVSHAFPSVKQAVKTIPKLLNTVEYQIGVDVLGFPIYLQHQIKKGETKQSKFYPKPKKWMLVIQKIIKQH